VRDADLGSQGSDEIKPLSWLGERRNGLVVDGLTQYAEGRSGRVEMVKPSGRRGRGDGETQKEVDRSAEGLMCKVLSLPVEKQEA